MSTALHLAGNASATGCKDHSRKKSQTMLASTLSLLTPSMLGAPHNGLSEISVTFRMVFPAQADCRSHYYRHAFVSA